MAGSTSGRLQTLILLPPILFYSYPGLSLFLADSEVPIYFSRYSMSLLLTIVLNATIICCYLAAMLARVYLLSQLSLLALCIMTLIIVGNNDVASLPHIQLILPAIRFSAALSMFCLAFMQGRTGDNPVVAPFMMAGSIVIALCLLDLIVYVTVVSKEKQAYINEAFRDDYDLNKIEFSDILFVGDSFVWGGSVTKQERFCERALVYANKLHDNNGRLRIYCLGWVGTNMNGYIRILDRIECSKCVDKIFVFFYHNDFPGRPSVWTRLHDTLVSMEKSSKTLAIGRNLITKSMKMDVIEYENQIVGNYNRSEGSFGRRWEIFDNNVDQLYATARRIATGEVFWVILPILANWSEYPLEEADRWIADAAAERGFVVLNPLNWLTSQGLRGGATLRAGPNDNHYNAMLNDQIGAFLAAFVARSPE